MNIIIHGSTGRMGKILCDLLTAGYPGLTLAARVSPEEISDPAACVYTSLNEVTCQVDGVIDFSHHTAVGGLMDFCMAKNLPVVVATTGHTPEEKALIFAAAEEIPVFYAGNVSLGIAVLCRLVKQAAAFFPDADIEIVETLNSQQADAPGATAMMLYNVIKEVRPQAWPNSGRSGEIKRTPEEVGIHSLRMGSLAGIHEVHIHAGSQCLTLKHEAASQDSLAEGAAAAARFMLGKGRGLYDMESLLNEKQ